MIQDYIVKDMDFTGCDPIIEQAISSGKAIKCKTEIGLCWVVGYNHNLVSPYLSTGNSTYLAEPIKRNVEVKSLKDLVNQLLDDGYYPCGKYWCDENTGSRFSNERFQYCGKEPSSYWKWREEWLVDVGGGPLYTTT